VLGEPRETTIKASKLYGCDIALRLIYLLNPNHGGPHLENPVLMDFMAWRDIQSS
jgi:hypothetical protein